MRTDVSGVMPGHKLYRARIVSARRETNNFSQLDGFLHVLMVFKPLTLTCVWPGRGYPGSPSDWIVICSATEDCHGISYAGKHWEIAKEGAGIAMKKCFRGGMASYGQT